MPNCLVCLALHSSDVLAMAKKEFFACVEDEGFDRNDCLNKGFLKVVEKAEAHEKRYTDFLSEFGIYELPECLQYILYIAYSLPYWHQTFSSLEEETIQKTNNPILVQKCIEDLTLGGCTLPSIAPKEDAEEEDGENEQQLDPFCGGCTQS